MAKQNRVKLSFDDELYYPEAFKNGNITETEMRKEYQRLRRVAEKRLQRFEGTRFETSQTYLRNKGKYKPSSQITDPHELSFKLYDLYKMLTAKSGSISGIRDIERRTLETAHERGMTFLNKHNIQAFGQYMEFLRWKHMGRQFDSERAQDLFRVAEKKGINPMEVAADFDYWQKDQIRALEKTPKFKNPEMRTAEEYKKRIEQPNKKKKKSR